MCVYCTIVFYFINKGVIINNALIFKEIWALLFCQYYHVPLSLTRRKDILSNRHSAKRNGHEHKPNRATLQVHECLATGMHKCHHNSSAGIIQKHLTNKKIEFNSTKTLWLTDGTRQYEHDRQSEFSATSAPFTYKL